MLLLFFYLFIFLFFFLLLLFFFGFFELSWRLQPFKNYHIYSTAKETRKFATLKLIKNIVSLTCNIYSLNSTYFIFNQFKSNKFLRFFCCWVYIGLCPLLILDTSAKFLAAALVFRCACAFRI